DRRDPVVEPPGHRREALTALDAEVAAAIVRVLVEAGALARERTASPFQPPAAVTAIALVTPATEADHDRRDRVVPAFALQVQDLAAKVDRLAAEVAIAVDDHVDVAEDADRRDPIVHPRGYRGNALAGGGAEVAAAEVGVLVEAHT